jgi:tetratricopeptide (TPR) repeat protein
MRHGNKRVLPILCIPLLLLAAPRAFGGEPDLEVLVGGKVMAAGDTVQHAGSSLQVAGIASGEGGIARVLVNGREATLSEASSRDLMVVGLDEGEANRFRLEVLLRLGPNAIEVAATDVNYGETKLSFVVERVSSAASYRPPGEVYALIIGINDYADPDIPDLRFAENDAESIYHLLTDEEHSLAKAENVRYLSGAQATTNNIKKVLYEHLIVQATRPEDMAIFFYAGHGDVGKHPVKGSEYYMIPQDAELKNLFVSGIVKDDLQRLWSAIPAKRKIFISDACNSGGFTGMRGGASYGFEEALGEGKIVFSAAKADQKSLELPELGHGIFTHTMLQGLEGEADGGRYGNGDGLVSVKELASYLSREVPSKAAKVGGRQNPQIEILEATGDIILSRIQRPVEALEEESAPAVQEEEQVALATVPEEDVLQDMLSAVEYCDRAEDYLQQGDTQRAVLEYRRALHADPDLERVHVALSELYLGQKKYTEATQHAEKAVAINPNSERGQLFLGQALQGQGSGDADRIRQAFQGVLQLNPGNASAHIGLGALDQSFGDLESAIEHFENAVNLVDNPATLYHLGSAYARAGQFNRAEGAFEKVIEGKEEADLGENASYFLGAHRGLGFINSKKKNYVRALLAYQAALKYDQENLDIMLELGEVLVRKRDYEKAVEMLSQVTEKRKEDVRAHFSMGFALLMLGETSKGEVHLRFVEKSDQGAYGTQARTLLEKMRQH